MIKKIILFLLSSICCVFVGICTYYLAIWIHPPYVITSNGSRYGLMPIGQVMVAILVSVIMIYPAYRILRKRFEK
jgi:hypothetical protein